MNWLPERSSSDAHQAASCRFCAGSSVGSAAGASPNSQLARMPQHSGSLN